MADGLFLGHLQIHPGLAKRTVLWLRNFLDGTKLGDLDGVFHENFDRWYAWGGGGFFLLKFTDWAGVGEMDRILLGSLIGGDRGVTAGVSSEKVQMDLTQGCGRIFFGDW